MNGEDPLQPVSQQPVEQPEKPKEESSWEYKSSTAADPAPAGLAQLPEQSNPGEQVPSEVTWTASEFIEHSKGLGWFLAFGAIVLVVNAITYLWTRDLLSVFGITFMSILFVIVAARKPKIMEYHLDARGFYIGTKFYPYKDFKTFAIMDDGAFASITFMPLKRFMPPVSIYYDPKDEEQIVAILSQFLPLEYREHDMIDRLNHRIRF